MADIEVFAGITRTDESGEKQDIYRNETLDAADVPKVVAYLMGTSSFNRKRKTDAQIAEEQAAIDAWKALPPDQQMRGPMGRMGRDTVDPFTSEPATLDDAIYNYGVFVSETLLASARDFWNRNVDAQALATAAANRVEKIVPKAAENRAEPSA